MRQTCLLLSSTSLDYSLAQHPTPLANLFHIIHKKNTRNITKSRINEVGDDKLK